MQPTRTLDSLHRKDWHRIGKRIAVAQVAEVEASFCARMASLPKAADFTQIELAGELRISQRMVAYYKRPQTTPPANLLPQFATVLGVTTEEMSGRSAKRKLAKQEGDSRA